MEHQKLSVRYRAKIIAKERLRGNLLAVMGAVLVCALPLLLVTSMMNNYMLSTGQIVLPLAIYLIMMIAVVMPLVYGLASYLVELLIKGQAPILRVFEALTSPEAYRHSVKLGLCMIVRIIQWMWIPVALTMLFIWMMLGQEVKIIDGDLEQFTRLVIRAAGFYMMVSIPFCACVLRYAGAYLLVLRNPSLSPWQATRQSARCLKGHWGQLTVFLISFLGWQLFGMWTMGLGMLFYWGYLLTAFFSYYCIVERENHEQGTHIDVQA